MPQAPKPLLSIVIVSYNVKDFLLECLGSIQKFVSVPCEVIVVDNASADDTCLAVKQTFPQTVLIESKQNLGFSKGNNLGFRKASGDFILMLNPDAALIDGSFSMALAFVMGQRDNKILAGPYILNPDKSHQSSAWKFPGSLQLFLESIFLNKFFDLSKYPQLENIQTEKEVDFISGAAILMSRKTLGSLEGLDEDLFWMDDTDLCFRNKKNGGTCFFFPQWKVMHHIGKSSKKNLSLVISNQLISKLKFFKKHKWTFTRIMAVLIFFTHIKLRLTLLIPAAIADSTSRQKLKAYWHAYFALWRYLLKGKHVVTSN